MTAVQGSAYPATFTLDPPERIANWRPLVQWFLGIPHILVLYVLAAVGEVLAIISWFAIMFTGRMPEGLANAICMVHRYSARAQLYLVFMVEDYPPFTFSAAAADPGDVPRVRVDFTPQLEERNRLTVFFRFLLVIPQAIVLGLLVIAAFVCIVIGFFAVLFTGRWPEGLRDFVLKVFAWGVRFQAYEFLLTDQYPPFSLD